MRKKLRTTALVVGGYVVVSSLVHYGLFPEPEPDPSDLPRSGTTIENQGIHSKFVSPQTSIETAGQLFEWDNFVEPGGGPIDIPHVRSGRPVYMVSRFEPAGRQRICSV